MARWLVPALVLCAHADHVSTRVHLYSMDDSSWIGIAGSMIEEALLMTVFIAFIIFACNKGLCNIVLKLWLALYGAVTGTRQY